LAQNSSKQTQCSQNKNNIDFNNLITENNIIIKNNIGMIENIEIHPVDSIPIFIQIPNSSPQELKTTMEVTDTIVIEDNGTSILPFQEPLNTIQSTFKYVCILSMMCCRITHWKIICFCFFFQSKKNLTQ